MAKLEKEGRLNLSDYLLSPEVKHRLPKHVAFIMDGNRRWSQQRKETTFDGHHEGYKRIEPIVERAIGLEIPYLTFWAFSPKNFERPPEEVDSLMEIFRIGLGQDIRKLAERGAKIVILGDLSKFPEDIQEKTREIVGQSKSNTKITVNIALSYEGRQEILRAVNELLQSGLKQVDEEIFSGYLYTNGQPNPDLIIRTGHERRLSGFMPWQGTDSELYFGSVLWPDFTPDHFDQSLLDFIQRKRRFGK